ncbi:MAG: hypothetical protein JSS72_11075 [Armatimonadetes bacterium]|nr:hypothetical protein [Armatimonadota bacterium]
MIRRLLLAGTCAIATIGMSGPQRAAPSAPTFSKDVAPILYKRCVSCHSESRVAPFTLVGYENARKHAATIASVTSTNFMPPWKANPHYGEFKDIPVLTPQEKSIIAKWAATGAPEGDPKSAPEPPKITPGWRLGQPDMVIAPEKPTKISAEGVDFYRDYLIDPHITKPTWVRAVDFRPSQKGTVHHVIPSLVKKEEAEKCRKIKFDHEDNSWDQRSIEPIETYNTLGFWSTGAPPFESPQGTAFLINPGDCILMDMHYKTTGKPEVEQTQVGLYFSSEPPKDEMNVHVVASDSIYLEPGQRDVRVFALGNKTKHPTTIYAVWPHMHYLGRTFKAWVKYPAGYSKPLVCINDWDPDWQLLYYLKKPLEIPAGSRIYVTGTYDNSAGNPRNPYSPPRVVDAGPSSKDEMLFFELFQVVHKPKDKDKPK